MDAYVDEYRVSNVARWTSNFTPPNAPYTDQEDGPVTGLISFYDQNGDEEYFISQAGNNIWLNRPEGQWNPITGTVQIINNQNNLASMAVLNNILYGVDRLEDQFWKYNLQGVAVPVDVGALYSVSVNKGGQGYKLGDILTVQGGTNGMVQVIEVTTGTNGAINTSVIENQGVGYVIGDILNVAGGSSGQIQVTGINGNGGITSYSVTNAGQTYSITTGEALSGGSGTGATLTILSVFIAGAIEAVSIYDATGLSVSGKSYQSSTETPVSGGNGTGATIAINAVTPQINGNFVVNFNQSIFVNAGSTLPTALYYSDLNLGYAINPINFLLFNTGQGSYLTGAVNGLFGNLFVFKNKSIHVVSPTGSIPSYSSFLYTDGIGCVSHQSIVTLPGGTVMFWDTDDIYMIVGNEVLSATNHPKEKTPRLRNLFRDMVNQNRLKFVCGAYYAPLDCVFWFYSSPSSNSNDMCLAYHVKTKSFWPLTLRASACAIRLIQNTSMLYTGDIDGFIYQQDNGGSFNGSAINWNVQIPWQDLGDLLSRKKGDLVYTILEQQSNFNVYCDVYLNQNNNAFTINNILQTLGITTTGGQFDTAIFDTSTFATSSAGIMESSFLINALFKTISLNFHGSQLNQPLSIDRISITSRKLELSRLTD